MRVISWCEECFPKKKISNLKFYKTLKKKKRETISINIFAF